jgi:hypothetical protein
MTMHSPYPLRENPYKYMGAWYWIDESGRVHGGYSTQIKALRAMCYHLDPPWWVKLAQWRLDDA